MSRLIMFSTAASNHCFRSRNVGPAFGLAADVFVVGTRTFRSDVAAGVAGMAVLAQSGGASGAVFGTFFIDAGKPLSQSSLNASGYAAALIAGLDAVQARGKAKPGDKTMVDALSAAIAAVADAPGQDLRALAVTAAAGARTGSNATKDMIASTGKAKTLGARSLGHVDPGSITLCLVLEAWAEALSSMSVRQHDRTETDSPIH